MNGKKLAQNFSKAIAAVFLISTACIAQEYPAKPIRIVLGFSPGGSVDLIARIASQRLSEGLGGSVVVENQAGASGTIANVRVAKSTPDGYTLLVIPNSATYLPAMKPDMPYDLERDFSQISLLALGTGVLVVTPSSSFRSVKDIVTFAKANPRKLHYATDGVGTAAHVAGMVFESLAGIEMVDVPYKGASMAAVGIAGGQVQMGFPGLAGALASIKSGKIRAVAVTSGKRSKLLPDIPSIDESGVKGFDRPSWYGLMGPAKMQRVVVEKLNKVLVVQMNTAATTDLLIKQTLEPFTSTPEQFAIRIRNDIAQNRALFKKINLTKK